jgi:hypothetical protein
MPEKANSTPPDRKPKKPDEEQPPRDAAVDIEPHPEKIPEGNADNLRRRAHWFRKRHSTKES